MPDIQEVIALGIVALVAGRWIWRRRMRRQAPGKSGDCSNCASSSPPPKETTVHFYRRRNDETPPEA